MSSSTFYHKPELALRRALELEGIRQPEAALTLLHEVLSSRRHRTWSPAYEQIVIAYLNLCLKLHKAREAKDGLHQYRNLSQSQAPGSLEKVIRYLMEQAELQLSKAKANADAEAIQMAALIEADDDGGAEDGLAAGGGSPTSVLLSTMSTDPAKHQRDYTMVLPSLKFLWEIYRAILDILRSNSKLEHVYHAAAVGALQFCRVYKRRTEFRRLCDMLRMHLGNLQKYGSASISIAGEEAAAGAKPNNKVRGWEGWSSESIELHLQTRFAQLETASVLHLYTEGFRTVEDIYNILQISHARRKQNPDLPPPKAKLMAAYYEKLTTLFWVSQNYLFHAFAWYKYHALCKEYNRGMSDELRRTQGSAVLLAALCIPSLPHRPATDAATSTTGLSNMSSPMQSGATGRFDDRVMQEKMARMATLLGFHTSNPTREALLEEIKSRGIFDQVPEYLQQLYYLIEEDSDPLVLVEKAKPLLEQLAAEVDTTATADDGAGEEASAEDSILGRYVKPLTSVLLLKLLLNLSSAYHTVKIDHLKQLTSGLQGMTFEHVEKAIVLFTQTHKGLVVRIDHRAGCLRFGDAQLESDAMRSQLTVLAQQLESVSQILQPNKAAMSGTSTQDRAMLYQTIRHTREADHAAILERKALIEKRKEEAEILVQQQVREEQQKKAAEEHARKVEEERRIQREQRLREQEKEKKIQQEIEETKKKQLLKAMGHDTATMTQEEMAQKDIEKLQKEHADKLNKKREEAERKTKEIAKRLDYLVRAIRIEELPLVKSRYEEKVKQDREQHEQELMEKAQRAKAQWEDDVKDKAALSSLNVFEHMADFEAKVMESRRLQHVVICREADQLAEVEAEKGKIARARRRKQDEARRKADEEARLKKEEEERQAEEARRKREEARREKEAKEAERRQAEEARMAEERERKERQNQSAPARPSKDLDSAGNSGGGGGRYVPPSRRGAGGGGGGGSGGGGDRRFDDRGGGSRFGGGDRYEGGGRYEGRSRYGDRDRDDRRGGGGGGGGGYGDRDRGGYGDRRGGGGYGDRRDGDRRDGDRREGGGSDNNRWRR